MIENQKSYKRPKNAEDSQSTAKYYLSNSKLLPAVIESKAQGKVTDELAGMLLLLARRYAQHPWFSGYSYKEDMISEAVLNLCQNALKFNPEKYNNPFAYYTSFVRNSFLFFLNSEKKHRKIRDKLLIEIGENPSFNFEEEHKANLAGEYGSDMDDLKLQILEAKERVTQEEINRILQESKAAEEALAEGLANEITESNSSLLSFDDEEIPDKV